MRGRTGSIPTRRSTTTASRRCVEHTASRARSIGSPLPSKEESPMRVHTALIVLALLPFALGSLAAQTDGVRDVSASPRTVIPLQTKLRYTTMVLLPDHEEIVEVVIRQQHH